ADSVRVQAPIPGKGVVGIEVPNRQPAPVVLRQLMESSTWATSKASLPLALGQDVGGHVLMADLASLPHLLIAGAYIHFRAFPLPDTLFALNLFLFIDFYNIVIICYNSSLLV
ncbi:MAG: DNA translocase FtsK, partial [Bacilli bacterium]|nr:DNA translocase FtsK [Bacilli bacterium]